MKKILIFNWKDWNHPNAGGAEVVLFEHCKRLVLDGYSVSLITAMYDKNGLESKKEELLDGVNVHRYSKNKFLHSFIALFAYLKSFYNKYDIIIEVANTAPYFIGFFRGKASHFLFYHQLAREVWFYEAGFLLSRIGYYLLEPTATFLQSRLSSKVITISESSKRDLMKFGFQSSNIFIISEGIQNEPLAQLHPEIKEKEFSVLFHSSLRPMKRPDEAIKAFAKFKELLKK